MKDLSAVRKSLVVQTISSSTLLHTHIIVARGLIRHLSWVHAQPCFASVSALGCFVDLNQRHSSCCPQARGDVLSAYTSFKLLKTISVFPWTRSHLKQWSKISFVYSWDVNMLCRAQIWNSAKSRTVTLRFLIWQLKTSIQVCKNLSFFAHKN